jgi:uncharacterized RmlC-like cupin family protein
MTSPANCWAEGKARSTTASPLRLRTLGVEARPGDFVYVPTGAVHRESNPSMAPADVIVVRAGSGESTFNVGGPPSP